MTNKQAEKVVSFTVNQRYDFLELINAMKDLDNKKPEEEVVEEEEMPMEDKPTGLMARREM